jgi:hypothetical protein
MTSICLLTRSERRAGPGDLGLGCSTAQVLLRRLSPSARVPKRSTHVPVGTSPGQVLDLDPSSTPRRHCNGNLYRTPVDYRVDRGKASLAAAGLVCCGRLDRPGAGLGLHTVPSDGSAPEPTANPVVDDQLTDRHIAGKCGGGRSMTLEPLCLRRAGPTLASRLDLGAGTGPLVSWPWAGVKIAESP